MLNFNDDTSIIFGILFAYLNTSHVKLQQRQKRSGTTMHNNLNTSHVKLQQFYNDTN